MLKVGDLVSIIDENARARVCAILTGGRVVLEDHDGFELGCYWSDRRNHWSDLCHFHAVLSQPTTSTEHSPG